MENQGSLTRFEKKLLEMQVLKSAKTEEIRQGIQKQVKRPSILPKKARSPKSLNCWKTSTRRSSVAHGEE